MPLLWHSEARGRLPVFIIPMSPSRGRSFLSTCSLITWIAVATIFFLALACDQADVQATDPYEHSVLRWRAFREKQTNWGLVLQA